MQNRVRRTGWEVLMVKAHTRWKDGVWRDSSSWLCSGNASSTPDVPAKVSLLRYHLHFSLHDLRLIKHLPYSGSSQVSNSFCFRLFSLLFSCALPWSSVSLYLHLESIQASLWNPACMMSSSPLSGTRYQPHIQVCALMPVPEVLEFNDCFVITAMMHLKTDIRTGYWKLWWTIRRTVKNAQMSGNRCEFWAFLYIKLM